MSQAESTMTRDVVYVPPELSLTLAWNILQRWRIRHLPVVSGGVLRGILSDRDVLLRATASPDGTIHVPEMPVALAMTPQPITCRPSTPIADVARTMIEHKIDSVVVVDGNGGLAGLVTATDLLMLLLAGDPQRRLPYDFVIRGAG